MSVYRTIGPLVGGSVQQRNQISKKSLAKNVTQLMVDLKPELVKKTAVRL